MSKITIGNGAIILAQSINKEGHAERGGIQTAEI